MDSEAARRYLRLILRWWWLFVLSAVVPAAISYRLASQEPDIYEARATLVVGSSIFQDPDPDRGDLALSDTLAAAYAELATERSVLEPVMEDLALDGEPEALAKQVTTRIRSGAQLLEIHVADTNPAAAALIANRLADELIRRSPTSEQNTPGQQAFVESQLEELKAKIERTNEQISELSASLAELTSAAEIQEANDRIEALELVKSRYQETYAQLFSVSQEESPNALALFEPALVPGHPVPRRTKLVVALAGAAGLGLALSAVILMDYLDTSLRWDFHSGEKTLELPVLGVIPRVSTRGPLRRGDALSPVAEGVRAIRSKLYLMQPNEFFQMLVLTSPGESEGKSFVLANLAVALASGGGRVIAVDGDMRRPSLHELFDRPNLSGLADILADDGSSCEDLSPIPLQETDFDGLYLLSAGRPPADPAALLTSPRFQRLLDSLRQQGYTILIDSPPVLGAPDAAIIATRAEGTILVVSAGLTERDLARQARDLLQEQQGVNLLGLAINRAEVGHSYYHYYTRATGDEEPWWKTWTKAWTKTWTEKYIDDGWLTLDEAATKLGISKRQARRWCREGQLPATKRWLFWWDVETEGLDGLVGGTSGARQNELAGTPESEQPEAA